MNFIIYENSFSDKKTFSDHLSHDHHWVHIFCNFFNNIFGSSCTISIGCTFCAISLIMFLHRVRLHILYDLLKSCSLLANSVQFHSTSSSQVILYDHICLQILCNFIDIFFSDHLAWSLLADSVRFVNIFSDYLSQLCNFIDVFSDCLACSCKFCAILLMSSQIILHHHSLQIYSHLLSAYWDITAWIFCAILLTCSQFIMHYYCLQMLHFLPILVLVGGLLPLMQGCAS